MSRLLLAAAVAGVFLASMEARAGDDPPRQRPFVDAALSTANIVRLPGNIWRGDGRFQPHATSVTWPSVVPPGWYTNTYNYAWYYPWYANYDYTHGPYANWMVGGGYAGYANHGPAGMYYSSKPPAEPYIGEWYARMEQRNALNPQHNVPQGYPGAYNALKELSGNPLPQPRPGDEPKKKKEGN